MRGDATAGAPESVSCDACGEVIGVYEPLIMLTDGAARETSRIAEPGLPLKSRYYHRACYVAA